MEEIKFTFKFQLQKSIWDSNPPIQIIDRDLIKDILYMLSLKFDHNFWLEAWNHKRIFGIES
jgi:hypothetical protein